MYELDFRIIKFICCLARYVVVNCEFVEELNLGLFSCLKLIGSEKGLCIKSVNELELLFELVLAWLDYI